MIKHVLHHDLPAIQALFASGGGSITRAALESARAMNYTIADIRDVIGELSRKDFVKSETAHNPPNSKIWHDTYVHDDEAGGIRLFIKFAGETVSEISLTSFKEK